MDGNNERCSPEARMASANECWSANLMAGLEAIAFSDRSFRSRYGWQGWDCFRCNFDGGRRKTCQRCEMPPKYVGGAAGFDPVKTHTGRG